MQKNYSTNPCLMCNFNNFPFTFKLNSSINSGAQDQVHFAVIISLKSSQNYIILGLLLQVSLAGYLKIVRR